MRINHAASLRHYLREHYSWLVFLVQDVRRLKLSEIYHRLWLKYLSTAS